MHSDLHSARSPQTCSKHPIFSSAGLSDSAASHVPRARAEAYRCVANGGDIEKSIGRNKIAEISHDDIPPSRTTQLQHNTTRQRLQRKRASFARRFTKSCHHVSRPKPNAIQANRQQPQQKRAIFTRPKSLQPIPLQAARPKQKTGPENRK